MLVLGHNAHGDADDVAALLGEHGGSDTTIDPAAHGDEDFAVERGEHVRVSYRRHLAGPVAPRAWGATTQRGDT
ncbi:MAG: hypothetical protein AAB295_07505, partial [Chloroflexota bacterium]